MSKEIREQTGLHLYGVDKALGLAYTEDDTRVPPAGQLVCPPSGVFTAFHAYL